MSFVITAAERASFNRCRRQWDFGSGNRQDLEPLDRPVRPDLDRAVRDALAVYYFPGMWDWDRGVRLPLVVQELERALARQRQRSGVVADATEWQEQLDAGRALLDRYFRWAPTPPRAGHGRAVRGAAARASGGGRSIPQHRRMYVQAREPARVEPIDQHVEDVFRRTWLRRTPTDVAEAGRRLGADVAEMAREDLDVYPEPSDQHCPACPYLDPCRALMAGTDAQPIVLSGYRRRPPEAPEEGRFGGRAWGMGRGAAPPRFPRGRDD